MVPTTSAASPRKPMDRTSSPVLRTSRKPGSSSVYSSRSSQQSRPSSPPEINSVELPGRKRRALTASEWASSCTKSSLAATRSCTWIPEPEAVQQRRPSAPTSTATAAAPSCNVVLGSVPTRRSQRRTAQSSPQAMRVLLSFLRNPRSATCPSWPVSVCDSRRPVGSYTSMTETPSRAVAAARCLGRPPRMLLLHARATTYEPGVK
mmetsp:Transcript_55655/g.120214  ORF Transcript_55655/g.120214 Transcript_55655/m.120214 type:complete len:206 (+) Transcript_55655:374-991(+)